MPPSRLTPPSPLMLDPLQDNVDTEPERVRGRKIVFPGQGRQIVAGLLFVKGLGIGGDAYTFDERVRQPSACNRQIDDIADGWYRYLHATHGRARRFVTDHEYVGLRTM